MRAKNEAKFLAEAYNTKLILERVVDGTLMCPEACCGAPVMECKCGPDCPHCNCHEIQKLSKKEEDEEMFEEGLLNMLNPFDETKMIDYIRKMDGRTLSDIRAADGNEDIIKATVRDTIGSTAGVQNAMSTIPNHLVTRYLDKPGAIEKIVNLVNNDPEIKRAIDAYHKDSEAVNRLIK